MLELLMLAGDKPKIGSQITWTTPGTYQWTVPVGVTEVSVLLIGAGARGTAERNKVQGGIGGAVRWKNKIAVTPGQVIPIVVGNPGFTISRPIDTAIAWNLNTPVLRSTAFGIYAGSYNDVTAIGEDMGGRNGNLYNTAGPFTAINSGGTAGELVGGKPDPKKYGYGLNPVTGVYVAPTYTSGDLYDVAGNAGGGGQSRTNRAGDSGNNVTTAGGNGAVRIIWGEGRAYPDKGISDIR